MMPKINKNIDVIIPARMESSRLPGKVLLPLNNIFCIHQLIYRLTLSQKIRKIIIAIPESPLNSILKYYINSLGYLDVYTFMSLKYDDILGRVIDAANHFETDIIVDVTQDCPLVDPLHIDRMIDILLDNDLDYISNCFNRSWPDGLDIQIYTKKILKKCLSKKAKSIEHVGWNIPFLFDGLSSFKWIDWAAPNEYYWPDLGLTLDEIDDWKLLNLIFAEFQGLTKQGLTYFPAKKVIDFLRENPEYIINKNVKRNVPGESK